jgi:NIPSNAP
MPNWPDQNTRSKQDGWASWPADFSKLARVDWTTMRYGRRSMRSAAALLTCAIGVSMNAGGATPRHCCPVIELRQYTLKPGQRDVLIDLFDRHFVESQEAAGMTIVGQFRDRRRPDRFVWIRGFPDMTSRHQALERFYGGPAWAAHRAAANATMVDVSDVLLLRPVGPVSSDGGFLLDGDEIRAGTRPRNATTVLAGVYTLSEQADDSLVSRFEKQVAPRLQTRGLMLKGVFVTETAPNTFTRLPVREGEHVLVWVATIEGSPERLESIAADSTLAGHVPAVLDLEPTSRSLLGDGIHATRASKHDFDFLHRSWDVHNRYLKGRMRRSTEWAEFDAQSEVQPLLNGLGQLDRFRAVRDGNAIEGVTLRLFNPATGEWSLHWADTFNPGVLLPPMVGRFNGDVGEFFGDEFVDGKKVLCRFYWTRTNPASPRWEQAFSDDGGKTWETNWVMALTRR